MKVFITIAVVVAALAVFAVFIQRDGELVTPIGSGKILLPVGEFEAFPLPDYAARHITPDYKSYFIEVQPGIKVHVLEVGQGYPVFLQHGNPTSGLLYRRIAAQLRVRWKEFGEGLGRLGFAATLLLYTRPFLGPLYAWVSACPQALSRRPPLFVKLVLKWFPKCCRITLGFGGVSARSQLVNSFG